MNNRSAQQLAPLQGNIKRCNSALSKAESSTHSRNKQTINLYFASAKPDFIAKTISQTPSQALQSNKNILNNAYTSNEGQQIQTTLLSQKRMSLQSACNAQIAGNRNGGNSNRSNNRSRDSRRSSRNSDKENQSPMCRSNNTFVIKGQKFLDEQSSSKVKFNRPGSVKSTRSLQYKVGFNEIVQYKAGLKKERSRQDGIDYYPDIGGDCCRNIVPWNTDKPRKTYVDHTIDKAKAGNRVLTYRTQTKWSKNEQLDSAGYKDPVQGQFHKAPKRKTFCDDAIRKQKLDRFPGVGKYNIKKVKTPGGKIDKTKRVTAYIAQAVAHGKEVPAPNKYKIGPEAMKIVKQKTNFALKWSKPGKEDLKRGEKLKKDNSLAPNHYKELDKGINATLPKQLDLKIAKAAIKRYYDHEIKRTQAVPGVGAYYTSEKSQKGLNEFRAQSKSPMSLRTRRH